MELLFIFEFKKITDLKNSVAIDKVFEIKKKCEAWTKEYGTPVRLEETFGNHLCALVVFNYPNINDVESEKADQIIEELQADMKQWSQMKLFDASDIYLDEVLEDPSEYED